MSRPSKYPRADGPRIRLGLERSQPIAHIARDLGIEPESLGWQVRRAEIDAGKREGLRTVEREELGKLHRENFELRRFNEILKSARLFSPYNSTQIRQGEPLY